MIKVTSHTPGLRPQGESEPAGGGDDCNQVISWGDPDAGTPDAAPPPPPEETHTCPSGEVRVHVRDMWSALASPTLNQFPTRPIAVVLVDPQWNEFAARPESAGCDWYAGCVPAAALSTFHLKAIGPDSCAPGNASGGFDAGAFAHGSDLWIDYGGTNLSVDYAAYPSVPIGGQAFRLTDDSSSVTSLCAPGKADTTIPEGYTKLHIRWMWGDPDKTGFAGTACADPKLGFDTPPYPTSLIVARDGCNDSAALLEYENADCPWYSVLIPNAAWQGSVTIRYPDNAAQLYSPALKLPQPRTANEYWLAYGGAPDAKASYGSACSNWSQRSNVYYFYSKNPGPGYMGCGSDTSVPSDPCNPPVPDGYSTVHFRYIWAGQKTFTFFPKPELMPHWIVLEVNGGGGNNDIICFREADRPWFNCQVPNSQFSKGATWRAVDKSHTPEWNTVAPRTDFPDKPGEYWLRWDYGKPDIPATSRFKFFNYYPDATNGDYSATGNWNDQNCAPKPPPTTTAIGFGGWFPYKSTGYAYPFGASLARTYAGSAKVQELLNAFVYQRYLLWRDAYVTSDTLTCGADTARVKTDPPETVSEGQGYGIAMAAAIGDKETFDKLWNFVRHFLSQSKKKYCGGLMGWMWDSRASCRPIDTTCDPDSGSCGGNSDSAFDGDVDIGIGLVYAARQWPEYTAAAVDWLLKMECEVNTANAGFNYPAPGDTWDKNCDRYPDAPCHYTAGQNGSVNLSYYPPGYFRVFGDFLKAALDSTYSASARETHRQFWYDTARTVYELVERCYDASGVQPGLVTDWGHYATPCDANTDNYNWSRALWRLGIDAAWFGNRTDLSENHPGASAHYASKSRVQAKIDAIQNFYSNFHLANPTEPNANRFSTICQNLTPEGTVTGCDPGFGHNSYFVNTAMSAFVNVFDDGGRTTPAIRREALEEAVSTTVENDKYYQESLGVYTMMFISGNFPNPMQVP
ncbi:MAG TPA: glycosyl hydrolase family 8 [Polyangiaceae bacterium]|nr:glycosyl hydrolase family 8 [Polyangiaceae bacterium]